MIVSNILHIGLEFRPQLDQTFEEAEPKDNEETIYSILVIYVTS